MNILNNKNKRTSIFKALALCLFAAVSFTFVSCDDDMDIQQSYPFTVETMPVPNKVTKGQTVEIRCELKKTGDFANTLYTIRYFQFEGEGTLKMDNGITFLPNDRYLLENEKFRLYYTAQGDEAHNFIVVVEDNFGNSYELEFDFNNRNVKDDGVITVVPIGKFCAMFQQFGKDSLLLATLAYNVGPYRLLGSGKIPKSTLIRKLEAGDRNIYREYIAFCNYKGKRHAMLLKRRKAEFALLYVP